MAAVYPAGPDPMMTRSRTPSCSAGGITGSVCSSVTAGPGVGWSVVTRGTTRILGAAFPARPPAGSRRGSRVAAGSRGPLSAGPREADLGDLGGEPAVGGHQPGDPQQHVPGGHRLVEGQVRRGAQLTVRDHLVGAEVAVGLVADPDLHGGAVAAADADRGQGLLRAEVVEDVDPLLEVAERR